MFKRPMNLTAKKIVYCLPFLELAAIICGFSGLSERDNSAKFALFAACMLLVVIGLVLCFHIVNVSTGISHTSLSTVNFTLPFQMVDYRAVHAIQWHRDVD